MRDYLLQYIQQDLYRFERREDRHVVLDGRAANLVTFLSYKFNYYFNSANGFFPKNYVPLSANKDILVKQI